MIMDTFNSLVYWLTDTPTIPDGNWVATWYRQQLLFGSLDRLNSIVENTESARQLIENVCASSCIPVVRWAPTASAMTSRADGLWGYIVAMFSNIPLNMESLFLNWGNGLWSAAAWLCNIGQNTQLTDRIGRASNMLAATLYKGVTANWMLFAIITVMILMSGLWLAFRTGDRRQLTRRVGAFTMGVALFMTLGYSASLSVQGEDAWKQLLNPPTPGEAVFTQPKDINKSNGSLLLKAGASPGTPWWLTNLLTRMSTMAGGSIATGLSQGFDSSGSFLAVNPEAKSDTDLLSCRRYLGALRQLSAKQLKDPVVDSLSRQWEETGLRLWALAQYGQGENGAQVFCRVPEVRANTDPVQMAYITQLGSNGKLKLDGRSVAFNPYMLATIQELDKSGTNANATSSSQQLDRMVVMFDVCGVKSDGSFYVRPGWGFVNNIEGTGRGLMGDDGDNTIAGNLGEACSAAISGDTSVGTYSSYRIVQLSTQQKQVVEALQHAGWNVTISGDSASGNAGTEDIAHLVSKFDIDAASTGSNWQSLAANPLKNNGTAQQNSEAIATYLQQRGNPSLADTAAAFMFALAGFVNFAVWGLAVGFLRLLALIASYLLSSIGLMGGALIYAIAPERGRTALKNTMIRLCGMCAAGVIISLVALLINLITNLIMLGLGFLDQDGNTTTTPMIMAIISLISTPASLKLLQYLCVNVWRIGDPLSLGNMVRFASGVAIGQGLVGVAGAVVGGVTAGIAGRSIVSGVKGAVGGFSRASGGGVRGVMGAAAQGAHTGSRDRQQRGFDMFLRHGSQADQAAVAQSDTDKPTETDTSGGVSDDMPVNEPPQDANTSGTTVNDTGGTPTNDTTAAPDSQSVQPVNAATGPNMPPADAGTDSEKPSGPLQPIPLPPNVNAETMRAGQPIRMVEQERISRVIDRQAEAELAARGLSPTSPDYGRELEQVKTGLEARRNQLVADQRKMDQAREQTLRFPVKPIVPPPMPKTRAERVKPAHTTRVTPPVQPQPQPVRNVQTVGQQSKPLTPMQAQGVKPVDVEQWEKQQREKIRRAGRGAKRIVTAPARFIARHPRLSTATVTTLAAANPLGWLIAPQLAVTMPAIAGVLHTTMNSNGVVRRTMRTMRDTHSNRKHTGKG